MSLFQSYYYKSTCHEAWQIIPKEYRIEGRFPSKKRRNDLPFDISIENDSWWYFENEEDFSAIIKDYLEITEQYGLDYFSGIDHSDEEVFSNQYLTELYERHTELHDSFAKEHDLKTGLMTDENIDEWFRTIDNVVEQKKTARKG